MAISENNKSIIKLEAAKKVQTRKEILKNSNLKIQWDKQGKHIEGHKNYLSDNRSILVHQEPQKLVNNYAGRGFKDAGEHAGLPGYKEVVNFEEFIGYAVDSISGEKIATTWGKIHYAKDGVHIVPTAPRG
jgi:filamentous hemagglutinin